jgi:hypothetical protein
VDGGGAFCSVSWVYFEDGFFGNRLILLTESGMGRITEASSWRRLKGTWFRGKTLLLVADFLCGC